VSRRPRKPPVASPSPSWLPPGYRVRVEVRDAIALVLDRLDDGPPREVAAIDVYADYAFVRLASWAAMGVAIRRAAEAAGAAGQGAA